jgi:hypothetical protein
MFFIPPSEITATRTKNFSRFGLVNPFRNNLTYFVTGECALNHRRFKTLFFKFESSPGY